MNIPALSMSLSQIDTTSRVGVAMLAKSLDVAEEAGAAMIDMMSASMEVAVNPHIGGNIDFSV